MLAQCLRYSCFALNLFSWIKSWLNCWGRLCLQGFTYLTNGGDWLIRRLFFLHKKCFLTDFYMSQFVVCQAIHTHYLLINSLKQSLSLWWCLVIIGVSPPSSASWSWHRNTKAISRGPCKDSTTHKRQLDKSALIKRDYIAIHENNILWLALKCWLTETIHMFFSSLDWDNLFSKKEQGTSIFANRRCTKHDMIINNLG